MAVFIGATKSFYEVKFYHKRTEEIETEEVYASNESEAIKEATKKHRKSYKGQHFEVLAIRKNNSSWQYL